MKAILIADIPDDYQEYGSGDWYVVGDDLKIVYEEDGALIEYKYFGEDMEQLKPMPDKIDQGYPCDTYEEGYGAGWDECIDEILGGMEMTYTNNFVGKKRMVKALSKVYKNNEYSDIANIELRKYRKGKNEEEFIILTWFNGAISTANNNMNSLSATARNVARMLDGGVYENIDYYKDIMSNEEWEEILG